MSQGVKIFSAPLEDVKTAARKVFEVKDSTWEETRTGAFARRRDNKRSYTLSFMERADGTCEVRLSIDVTRGVIGSLRKKPTASLEDEIASIWKQMDLTIPSEDGELGKVMEDIRGLFDKGEGIIKMPVSVHAEVAPGGILKVTGGDGQKREIMIPEGMKPEVAGQVIKVD